jgi:hypothetical protein
MNTISQTVFILSNFSIRDLSSSQVNARPVDYTSSNTYRKHTAVSNVPSLQVNGKLHPTTSHEGPDG